MTRLNVEIVVNGVRFTPVDEPVSREKARGYLSEFPLDGILPSEQDIITLVYQYRAAVEREYSARMSGRPPYDDSDAAKQKLLRAYRDMARRIDNEH